MKMNFLIPLIAGLGLLCACRGKSGKEYEAVNNSGSADSTKFDTATLLQPKLVKTAGMRFKVKNVKQTTDRIMTLAQSVTGMVIHQQIGSNIEGSHDIRLSDDSVMRVSSLNTDADMIVKIPSVKLEEFIKQVAHMGLYINSERMDITDKSLEYLAAQLKLRGRTELVNQQKKGRVVIKDPANVLLLKDDMVDEQVGNRQIDDAVKNSIITLSFYESNTIARETIANDDPAAYNLPFLKRLGMAVENGLSLFSDFVIGIANLWLFILAMLGIWLLIRYYRKKPAVLAKG